MTLLELPHTGVVVDCANPCASSSTGDIEKLGQRWNLFNQRCDWCWGGFDDRRGSLQSFPSWFAIWDALREPRLKVSLFRCDNMKSVCIVDDEAHAGCDGGWLRPDTTQILVYAVDRKLKKLDDTKAGIKAVVVMKGCNSLRSFSEFVVDIREEEESSRLADLRDSENDTEARNALTNIPTFQIEIQNFLLTLKMGIEEGHDDFEEDTDFVRTYIPFENENDMAVALEGLRWS